MQGIQGVKGEAGTPTTVLWAVVNETGGLVRGKGISETQEVLNGFYEVESFQHNVSNCAWEATTATPGSVSAGIGPSVPTVYLKSTDPEALMVEMHTLNGAPTQAPFHIAVFC